MTNKHVKACSTLVAIREVHIKITTRYQDTPIRMTKIKNSEKTHWRRGELLVEI